MTGEGGVSGNKESVVGDCGRHGIPMKVAVCYSASNFMGTHVSRR